MIITIDGPAGAGKSSAARQLAQRLGFRFVDTGAMYRAVTLAAHQRGVNWNDENALAALTGQLKIELPGDRVLLDGKDVTCEIRTFQITQLTRFAAGNPQVRGLLVERQRDFAEDTNVVTEGRDQGTVVFPDAECKIFLTASPEERARRRLQNLIARGETISFEEVLSRQQQRDDRDSTRSVGPLVKALDAIEIVTDGLTPDDVVCELEALVERRRGCG